MRIQLGQTFRRRAAGLLTTVRNKFPIAHHQLPSPVAGEGKGEGKFHARHPHLNPLPPEEGEETASRGAPHCCPRRIYGFNRRMVVPPDAVAAAMEIAREQGTTLRRTAPELVDNAFAENLARSGFLKELWGSDPPDGIRK